jgi:carbonic anhydrase
MATVADAVEPTAGAESVASFANQSPINITGAMDALLPEVRFHYQAAPLHVEHTGRLLRAHIRGGGGLTIDGASYTLRHMDILTPSEHHVHGMRFPMEVQLVHHGANAEPLILSVLFKEGARHPVIAGLRRHASALREGQRLMSRGVMINAYGVLPLKKDYYRYNGSLTAPPFTEGVRWLVMKSVIEAEATHIQGLRDQFGDHARPVQPVNARIIVR